MKQKLYALDAFFIEKLKLSENDPYIEKYVVVKRHIQLYRKLCWWFNSTFSYIWKYVCGYDQQRLQEVLATSTASCMGLPIQSEICNFAIISKCCLKSHITSIDALVVVSWNK